MLHLVALLFVVDADKGLAFVDDVAEVEANLFRLAVDLRADNRLFKREEGSGSFDDAVDVFRLDVGHADGQRTGILLDLHRGGLFVAGGQEGEQKGVVNRTMRGCMG